jgi:curved DNA-binding protein CbpA
MSFQGDPYRILGLVAGASAEDVKRAYRRLAKQFHPDSAGPAALPRFLAIQAAYEALVDGADRLRSGIRPGSRAGSRPTSPAWQADPERAGATRDAWRRRPSARPEAESEAAASAGSARAGPRPGPRRRPDAERTDGTATGRKPRGGASGADSGAQSTPSGTERGRAGSTRGRAGKRKATLGSTSYDEAGVEPRNPAWDGATWYGASSGTYWTVNPKEYADPRKHGPEYLARARRAGGESAAPNGHAPGGEPEAWSAGASTAADGAKAGWDWSSVRGADATEDLAGPAVRRTSAHASVPGDRRFDDWPSTENAPSSPGDGTSDRASSTPEHPWAKARLNGAPAWSPRLVLALVGWPPIGFALVAIAGELTGCNRFAAACSTGVRGPFDAASWVVQLAVVGLLLLIPLAARLAAAGTIAVLAAALPVALLLSASGGSRDPVSAGNALVFALVLAWLIGVALAATGRLDVARWMPGRADMPP